MKPRQTQKQPLAARVASATFLIYFFFIFFGTSMPFKERSQDIDDITTSNALNQVAFSSLFVLSVISMVPKRRSVLKVLRQEKFLTLFLVWCLLSVLWSAFPMIAFKRLFQIICTVTVSLALLVHRDGNATAMRHFKVLLVLYLVLSYASIAAIPGAIDPDHGTWRGLSHSKNGLGQLAVISAIIWFYALRYPQRPFGRKVSFMMLVASIGLLLGGHSMTSILTLACLVVIGLALAVDEVFRRLRVGHAFSAVTVGGVMVCLIAFYLFAPDIIATSPELVGKDSSFTGRTDLWLDILDEAYKNIWIGCGFSSFWVVDNPSVLGLFKIYIWLPNEAHNGYLDILNETGIVGLALVLLIIGFYFRHLGGSSGSEAWKWFVIAAVIINIQESTLFRQNLLTGVMFIFGYLALFANRLHTPEAPPPAEPPEEPEPEVIDERAQLEAELEAELVALEAS